MARALVFFLTLSLAGPAAAASLDFRLDFDATLTSYSCRSHDDGAPSTGCAAFAGIALGRPHAWFLSLHSEVPPDGDGDHHPAAHEVRCDFGGPVCALPPVAVAVGADSILLSAASPSQSYRFRFDLAAGTGSLVYADDGTPGYANAGFALSNLRLSRPPAAPMPLPVPAGFLLAGALMLAGLRARAGHAGSA